MKSSEYKDLIAAIYRVVGAVERRFDALREADRQAVELAHNDLSRRLEGFPQQYATKVEAEQAAAAVTRLEKDSLPREVYEQNHSLLADAVGKVEREKLNESVFDTFVENYRLEQTRSAERNREVAAALSAAGDQYITEEYYDQRHSSIVEQVNGLQAWQYKIVGALVFATFIAPLLTGILVYLFTTKAL